MRNIVFASFLVALLCVPGLAQVVADVPVADFEGAGFSGWTAEGESFGTGAVTGNVGRQKGVNGFTGRYINSFHGDDKAVGAITSPAFTVERPFISFVIGGGNHPSEACIDLIVDGKVVRSATGNDDANLRPMIWNVKDLLGKQAILKIVDSHRGSWGWIGVDSIVQTAKEIAVEQPKPKKQQARKKPQQKKPAGGVGHIRTDSAFEVSHFADNTLVDNPMAVTADEAGNIYVAEARRFYRGVLDTRRNNFWMLDEMGIQSTEERREVYDKWIKEGKFADDFFTEYSDRIVRLTDTDGDGKADKRTVYAEGFNDALDGNGASVLYDRGKVYYTNIPRLWLLQDTNGDGTADEREVLQDGFGLRMGVSGHDMHGLEWGPDGKLYWSIGDRAYNIVTKEGKHLKDAEAGAVFRCDPDGSNIEIFCTGNRNPQDLAFDQYGNLFTVDNNQGRGDRSRVNYLVEGGDYGWQSGFENLQSFFGATGLASLKGPRPPVAWVEERLWDKRNDKQAAHVIPAVGFIDGGSCGISFVPGASLGDEYVDHFLFSGYQRGIKSFAVENEGAGMKMVDYADFWDGGLIIDADFNMKGELLVVDYVSTFGYEKGNIYLARHSEALKNPSVVEAGELLARTDWDAIGPGRLFELMAHRDMRVRRLAQQGLVAAGKPGLRLLTQAAANPVPDVGEIPDKAPEPEPADEPEDDPNEILVTVHRTQDDYSALAMGPPSDRDYADQNSGNGVSVKFVKHNTLAAPHAQAGAKGEMMPRTTDGRGAENTDDVRNNTWLDGKPYRLVMDLGVSVQVQQVHLYTWHRGNRAPQKYTLFGSNSDKADPVKLDQWEIIAEVDGLSWGLAGTHGSAIRRRSGALGTYRYLLWTDPKPYQKPGMFISELDVYTTSQTAPKVADVIQPPKGAAGPAAGDPTWKPEVFNGPRLRRLHGIWGLSQLGRTDRNVLKTLGGLLDDDYVHVRAQAARTLGDLRAEGATDSLVHLLQDDSPRVQAAAAVAVAKTGGKKAVKPLVALLKRNNNDDVYIRNAAVHGLQLADDIDRVLQYANDESAAVRLAVLLTLRRARDPRIAQFLNDAEPELVFEAVRAINDKRIDEAEPALAARIRGFLDPGIKVKPSKMNYARLVNANFRVGKMQNLQNLLDFSEAQHLDEEARSAAIYRLAQWQEPHPVDPTIGQLREPPPNRIDLTEKMQTLARQRINSSQGKLLSAWFHVALTYGVKLDASNLERQVLGKTIPMNERLDALKALAQNPTDRLEPVLVDLAKEPDEKLRIEALKLLAERFPDAAEKRIKDVFATGKFREKQAAFAILGTLKSAGAAELLMHAVNRQTEGTGQHGLALEILTAAEQRDEAEVKTALAGYKASLPADDPLAEYRILLAGGDFQIGKALVENHGTAQCVICHNIRGRGGVVAPDLSKTGERSSHEYFLESLINPSAVVVPGFGVTTITLKDGTAHAGSLIREDGKEVVLKIGDKEEKIAVANIANRTTPISSMPPMTGILKKAEIRDIVAYLAGLNKVKEPQH
jgi:putative membrane-bound dehydrogenase-like protein